MGTVNPQQIATNALITSSGINTPINQLAAEINGNLDDSNIGSLSGSKISAGTMPADRMVASANIETRFDEALPDFVASGCVWSAGSGLTGAMTGGVVYVEGKRISLSAVSSRTFTASKDTYVSVNSSGALAYSEVSNGGDAPSLPANSIWLAKVVTGASSISSVTTSGEADSGNSIYPVSLTSEWQSWDQPKFNGLSIGNGSTNCYYRKIGSTVECTIAVTFGSTTSISGDVTFQPPFPLSPHFQISRMAVGKANLVDAGTAVRVGEIHVEHAARVTLRIAYLSVSGSMIGASNLSSSIPFTWTTGDSIQGTFSYETA